MLLDSTPLPGLAPLYAQSFNSITWTEGFGLPTAGSGGGTVSIASCPIPIKRVYQPPLSTSRKPTLAPALSYSSIMGVENPLCMNGHVLL